MKKVLKINLIFASIFSINATIIYIFLESIYNMQNIFNFFYVIFIVAFVILNIVVILPICIIKSFRTTKKVINKQYIDSNDSIYTRELPEEYNSVIAGEIFEFKSSFENEYVAGTIELIGKGYILEKEGKLIINNEKNINGLLKNEKYILDTCTKVNKKTCWRYKYMFLKMIKEDMLELGLYKKNNFLYKIKNKITKFLEQSEKTSEIIGTSSMILAIVLVLSLIKNFKLTISIIIALYIMVLVLIRRNKLTSKGEFEKEKIGKLKLYFDKETDFVNKTEKEKAVWERYAAFAVALGSNKIIKEEIYEKYFNKKV